MDPNMMTSADDIDRVGTTVTDGTFVYTLADDPALVESPWTDERGERFTLDGVMVAVVSVA